MAYKAFPSDVITDNDYIRILRNIPTSGTQFMVRLHEKLQKFTQYKISTDKLWQGVEVHYSGHEVSGRVRVEIGAWGCRACAACKIWIGEMYCKSGVKECFKSVVNVKPSGKEWCDAKWFIKESRELLFPSLPRLFIKPSQDFNLANHIRKHFIYFLPEPNPKTLHFIFPGTWRR